MFLMGLLTSKSLPSNILKIFGGLKGIWKVLFGNPPLEKSKEKRRKNLEKNKKNQRKNKKKLIFSYIFLSFSVLGPVCFLS